MHDVKIIIIKMVNNDCHINLRNNGIIKFTKRIYLVCGKTTMISIIYDGKWIKSSIKKTDG